jgi:tetratricopeptide (TPR) repeat protein
MSTTGGDLLSRTVILIAAAGDASRFVLPKLRDRLYEHGHRSTVVPLWLRRYCLATWQLPQSRLSFLASHLTFIRTCLGVSFPVAVITGPNTNDAIAAHLRENNQFGLSNVTVIEQDSTSVFTPDGQLLFWENGEDLRAPNGMAGCVKALLDSEWFREQIRGGHEYVYIWYANDLTAGQHIAEHLEHFAANGGQSVWLSGPKQVELVERIPKTSNPKDRAQLIHSLEDSPGAYVFHHQVARVWIPHADPHTVKRDLPIVLKDGSFLWGYKREIFLCDPLWKQQEEYHPQAGAGYKLLTSQNLTTQLSPTRAEQYLVNLSDERLLQALESHANIEIPHDLGIKKVGENLVDDWRIESVIDEGGMSTVYVCRSEMDRERIAIKTYKENDRWLKPGVKAQFHKEGLAWILLPPHPHIVEALRIREIDGALHIYMEFAEGGNLRDRLKKGPLLTSTAIQIGIQVCDALQIVHDQDLLHKDVKPANILFDEHEHAQLSDFGLAASFYGEDLKEVSGTIFYMAPEFFFRGNITYAADIYSLGMVLYEMLAGVLPFMGTKDEVERQHVSVPPVPLIDRISEMDASLNEIVMACLAKLPQDRPLSAKELGERLRFCYQLLVGKSYEPVVPSVGNEADKIRLGRKRLLAYQTLGLSKNAMDVCENLRQVFPENPAVAMDHAFLYYEIDKFAECARVCVDLLSTATEPEILTGTDTLLEMCAIQLGKREEIVEAYTKWLQMAIGLSTIHGDARRSLKALELCVKIDPQCYSAWIIKGQLLYEIGDFTDATESLRKGLKTIWDFSQHGQCVKALETLEKCELILNPEIKEDFAIAHFAISVSHPMAIEQAARRVLSRVPNSIWAMDVLGTALEQQERYDEAIACFAMVLEAAPAHAHAHFTKGLAMLKSGKDREATLDEFELSVALTPKDYRAINMVGECYRLLGETSKAIEAFQKSLAINPQSIVALMAISTAFVQCGQPDSAIYFANQAVQFYPADPEAWEVRGDVLAAAGQPEQSLKSWEKALLIGGITPRLFEKMHGVSRVQQGGDSQLGKTRKNKRFKLF